MQGIEFDRMDSGMYLRDVCKIIRKYGDCLLNSVPFNVEMPECYNRLKDTLNNDIYNEALISKIESYARCETDEAIKYALMNYSPVLAAIKWYDRYELDNDGIIYFDTTLDYGYHAVMIYGFNENGWLCQNNYGKNWGKDGRFILPYNYGFMEAWSFVDAKNCDIYKPKQNDTLDIIYKIFNLLIDLIKNMKIKF